jgi:exodeoxyribonuclease V alpha subunit
MKPVTAITFEHFDHFFARFLNSKATVPTDNVYLAAALCAHVLRDGHIWCDLTDFAEKEFTPFEKPETAGQFPPMMQWLEDLAASGVVGTHGDYKPLILDTTSICMYRYWKYEQTTAEAILKKAGYRQEALDDPAVQECIDKISCGISVDQFQRDAIVSAVSNTFTVITGGPGTGKTTTVARIASVLLQLNRDLPYRIALAAPTGKAAMRLGDSLQSALTHLNLDADIMKRLPTETLTIHRLLGTIPGSVSFRHNKHLPLPYDLIIIDEASMVDIALMSKLLEAIPEKCKLILLGDKDQLASVEAGSVLADVCDFRFPGNVSETIPFEKEQVNPLSPVITLRKSFRFSNDSGIGQLAEAINKGAGDTAWKVLNSDPTCRFINISDFHTLRRVLAFESKQWFEELSVVREPEVAIALLDKFRILTALRQGQWGADFINQFLADTCKALHAGSDTGSLFNGMPLMVTGNDYRNNLFNGDTGILFKQSSQYYVFFKSAGNSVRSINLRLLVSWEPAFAITVHKSQGSEFSNTVFVLPPVDTPLLARELIYTAVTRSRNGILITGDMQILKNGIQRTTKRHSGLSRRM